MATRSEQIQVRIDFITDESKQMAKTILATKELNREIAESTAKLGQYEKQLKATDLTEAKRAEILAKVAAEEKKVADNLQKIAHNASLTAKIDLSKLTPAQVVERAKQLDLAMRHIPQSAPEYKKLNAELARTNQHIVSMRNSSRGLENGQGGGFGRLAGFAAKAAAAIAAAAVAFRVLFAGFEKAAKFEQLNIAFTTFLGSAEKAKTVLADLKKFEVQTPFDAEQVNGAGRALLAFGFSSESLIPTLRAVGDVAAGTGKDFNELALIYGKARAEGKIQNDTLNQLAEAGIPIYEELSKILDVGQDKIRKLAETGKIQFADLQKVFQNLSGEGGRFNGLMEKQSKSINGLFSSLSSAISEKMAGAVSGLIPLVKDLTSGFLNFLSVPVSEKIEDERQAFNGMALQVYNANVGTTERTGLVKKLKEQYPEYLKGLDAEKVTNEELRPILDKINDSYIVRIVLQKQQEKLQPLLEKQAETSEFLAKTRVNLNKALAHGAELSGVNLTAYETEAEQIAAVNDALSKLVENQPFHVLETDLERTQRALFSFQVYRKTGVQLEKDGTKALADAEKERLEITNALKESYGGIVDEIQKGKDAPVIAPPAVTDAEQAAKERQKAFDLRLKAIELEQGREEIALENNRLLGIFNEEQYQEILIGIQKEAAEKKLELARQFSKGDTKEVQAAEKEVIASELKLKEFREKAAAEKLKKSDEAAKELEKIAKEEADIIAKIEDDAVKASDERRNAEAEIVVRRAVSDAANEEHILREKFGRHLILEGEFNLELAKIRVDEAENKLQLLAAQGLTETEEFKKTLGEKAKADTDYQKTVQENEQRTKDVRQRLQQEALSTTADAFKVAIDFLSQDEAARKKHAGAIKAFEAAQVITAGITEVANIWKNSSQFGPFGYALAIIQTALAAARTGLAIKKIKAEKFAQGGLPHFGTFGGQPHSAGGTRGYFDDGTVIEVERDETFAVLNRRATPILQRLSQINQATGGVPLFESGGSVALGQQLLPNPSLAGAAGATFDFSRFEKTVAAFSSAVAAMPAEVKARVVYHDVEQAGTTLNAIRDEAAL